MQCIKNKNKLYEETNKKCNNKNKQTILRGSQSLDQTFNDIIYSIKPSCRKALKSASGKLTGLKC